MIFNTDKYDFHSEMDLSRMFVPASARTLACEGSK